MVKGELANGFKYEISDDVFEDWELLTALRKVDRGDSALIVDVAEYLLGEEQLSDLTMFMKKEGKVTVEKMVNAITEILEAQNKSKN